MERRLMRCKQQGVRMQQQRGRVEAGGFNSRGGHRNPNPVQVKTQKPSERSRLGSGRQTCRRKLVRTADTKTTNTLQQGTHRWNTLGWRQVRTNRWTSSKTETKQKLSTLTAGKATWHSSDPHSRLLSSAELSSLERLLDECPFKIMADKLKETN